MFGRYRRLVPWAQRDLIRRQGLPKPNWYVGSVESVHMTRDTLREIADAKARIDARVASRDSLLPKEDDDG